MGLNGSARASAPGIVSLGRASRLGPGVEKSMSKSSGAFRAGDLAFVLLFLCNSPNEGIAFGGVKGMLGLRIDLG